MTNVVSAQAGVPPGDRRENHRTYGGALTFDACATRAPSGYDEGIIRALVETRTPATLFLGGKWMAEHPEATRRLASLEKFELGNPFLSASAPAAPAG